MVALCQESPHDNGKEPDVTFFFRHWRENSLYVASTGPQHPDFGRFRGPAHGLSWSRWGLCALRHGIQISMEAILACHPARSIEWLDCHPKSCELHDVFAQAPSVPFAWWTAHVGFTLVCPEGSCQNTAHLLCRPAKQTHHSSKSCESRNLNWQNNETNEIRSVHFSRCDTKIGAKKLSSESASLCYCGMKLWYNCWEELLIYMKTPAKSKIIARYDQQMAYAIFISLIRD